MLIWRALKMGKFSPNKFLHL
uniref:Uncharacterized protein MANES_03G205100 n=1 Tax=Rhizophora mucronata TaxID=61149 RepID=A0A2P2IUT5_RHIMU